MPMSGGSVQREAGRVILLDAGDRVLLLHGTDVTLKAPSRWWFTPGGGCEADETHESAARREAFEELGIYIADLAGPCHERQSEFMFEGVQFSQHEVYFSARVAESFDVNDELWSDVERRSVVGTKWWTLDELRSTNETVYPEDLIDVVSRVLSQ